MVRKVFFSFHYDRDYWRVGPVRNSWVTKPDRETAGYIDKAKFEEVKRQGDDAVRRWIDGSLLNTSVTVVLIGAETSTRRWVRYEIGESYKRGNGILGIYINNIRNQAGETDTKGSADFGLIAIDKNSQPIRFSNFQTYDWVYENGYANLSTWIEKAAQEAENRRRGSWF